MHPRCPYCHKDHVLPLHVGRRTGSTIGTVAGMATGLVRTATLLRTLTMVSPWGWAGVTLGLLGNYVLGSLIGGAMGNAVGRELGELVDRNILSNYRCLSCGQAFSVSAPPAEASASPTPYRFNDPEEADDFTEH